jgi:adenylylsulfate kinase
MNKKQPIICIDVDGVIATKNKKDKSIGEPLKGSNKFLIKLHNLGWKIIIFSCRPKKMLESYLKKHKLYYDEINENTDINSKSPKPIADVYLDDRGLTFEGDFAEILNKIENFKPWWEE